MASLILVLSLVPLGVNMVHRFVRAKNVTEPHGAYQADFGYGLTGVVDPVFGCLNADEEPLNISIM